MNSFLYFIIIGALAGWIGGRLTRGRAFGLFGNILVGIVGAVLGVWIFGWMGISADNFLYQLAAAIVGSVVFLLLIGLFRKNNAR